MLKWFGHKLEEFELDSDLELGRTEDWRDGVGSQKEVMGHIHTHQLLTNSVLLVGEEKAPIKVIKEIVQSLSIVLERRLTSSNERDPQGLAIFHLNDIPLDSMTQLIKFAYTHEWDWNLSGEVGSLTSLLKLKEVADELKVNKLIPKIKSTIDDFITNPAAYLNPQNACHVFQEAILAGEENLKNAALKFILREANLVFSDIEHYKMLSEREFIEILKENELQVESELKLFHVALKWGKQKCVEMKENENLRKILKEILPFIRFTQMAQLEFVEQIQPTNVLELNEMFEMQTKLCLVAAGRPSSIPEQESVRKYRRADSHSAVQKSALSISSLTTIKVEEFNCLEATKMTEEVNNGYGQDFDIQLQFIPNSVDLMTFLQSTSATPSKLSVSVKSIQDLNFPPDDSSNLKFPQLKSLNSWSLDTKSHLEYLIQIVKNSPNLCRLYIGHFEYEIVHPEENWSNAITIFDSVSLEDVRFSCEQIDFHLVNENLLRKLKENGVSIKKLRFSNSKFQEGDLKILEYLNQDLEEIHLPYYAGNENIRFKCSFINLKVLNVTCGGSVLLSVLRLCPNIEQLTWYDRADAPHASEKLQLVHLTTLNINVYSESGWFVIENLLNCPILDELTILNAHQVKLSRVYATFPHIKKLKFFPENVTLLESLTGVKENFLKDEYRDPSFSSRPPYIGILKELTSLDFRIQFPNVLSALNLDLRGWTYGICHLTKLTHLQLPPTNFEAASMILQVLGAHCKQLESVKFQVVFGGYGTMNRNQVNQLNKSHNHPFKILSI